MDMGETRVSDTPGGYYIRQEDRRSSNRGFLRFPARPDSWNDDEDEISVD